MPPNYPLNTVPTAYYCSIKKLQLKFFFLVATILSHIFRQKSETCAFWLNLSKLFEHDRACTAPTEQQKIACRVNFMNRNKPGCG